MHTNKHTHIQSHCEGHCVLSGEFHQLFTRVTVGKFMTVLDKTINNITHTTLAHTHTHTHKATHQHTLQSSFFAFMCCVFEDKEGVVHYIIRAKWLHLILPSITHRRPQGESERERERAWRGRTKGDREEMGRQNEKGESRTIRWRDWERESVSESVSGKDGTWRHELWRERDMRHIKRSCLKGKGLGWCSGSWWWSR